MYAANPNGSMPAPVPMPGTNAFANEITNNTPLIKPVAKPKDSWFNEHVRSLYYHPNGIPRNSQVPRGRIWRAIVAEFFGTMVFVFFATGAATIAVIVNPEKDTTAIVIVAIGQAIALGIAIYSVGHVSGGHLNPAITIAVFIVGRINFLRAVLYIIAQICGALIGSLFLKAVIPGQFEELTGFGTTTVAPGYGDGRAVLLEGIMTFTLAWVIWATAIDPDGFGKMAPLAIGFVLIGDLIVGWLFTGSGMNPARSLAPAIVANEWTGHWVYWVGPIAGALFAAIIYDFILMSRPPNPSPALEGTRMETQVPGSLAPPKTLPERTATAQLAGAHS